MNLLWWLLFLVGGYLFGSISFARIVTKIVAPDTDLNSVVLEGSESEAPLKTVGATTASVKLGAKYGGIIGILDIFKGFIPTLVVKLIFPDQYYFLFIGLGVVIGHIWPLYYKFRGGGGLSATLGALLATNPLGILACVLIGFVIGMPILKNIAVAVLSGPMLFIFWSAIFIRDWYIILFAVLFNVVLILAVIPDIAPVLKAKKEGKEIDMYSAMDEIPMGKMMKKMMEKMGLSKDEEVESE